MKDIFKMIVALVTFRWLFDGDGSGCGCGGCLTWIILGVCMILYMLGLLQ